MLIAAMVCALVGFGLLVMVVTSPSDVYSWLLLVVSLIGLGCFATDWWNKHRRGRTPRT